MGNNFLRKVFENLLVLLWHSVMTPSSKGFLNFFFWSNQYRHSEYPSGKENLKSFYWTVLNFDLLAAWKFLFVPS